MRACFFKWICNFSYFSPTLIKFRSKAEIVIGLVPEMMMNLSSSPILVNQTKVRLTFLIIFNSNQLAKMKNICNIRALFCTFAFTTGNPRKSDFLNFLWLVRSAPGQIIISCLSSCVNIETLPKAQRTRGWRSSCQSNFFRSYYKLDTNLDHISSSDSRPSISSKILTKLQLQNLVILQLQNLDQT